jgi:hypothetical protein
MSPTIRLQVDGLPPIKRGAESMWGQQIGRIKSLRTAAEGQPDEVADLVDQVHLDVVVYASPLDGDLDGFVAGICDGLQPPHANYIPFLRAEDWADLPADLRPPTAVGFRDDRAITRISAERREPPNRRRYAVTITW